MATKASLMCTECDCEVEEGLYFGDPSHGPVVHKSTYWCIQALKKQRDWLQQELQAARNAISPLAGDPGKLL